VLSRYSLHRHQEVLDSSSVLLWLSWSTVTQVVESFGFRHQVVSTTHDTEDTEGPDPDSDNGNDVSPVLRPPAEQGETGGDDINDKDGTTQLPRWNRGPERTIGSGDENQPVLSQRDLQEKDTVKTTKVLNNTTLLNEHGSQSNPSTNSQNYTKDNGHTHNLGVFHLTGAGS